jgi:acetyl-CoA carboxylase biotin carboxylase subunit/3-methylcrotonyl-CoA carboxylase alpha subunit
MVRDRHGGARCLGERECSAQRRHQKVIEESPSPAAFLTGEAGASRRRELGERAIALLASVDYTGVATVELVADSSGALYFLEVNARLQVEHPVTELVTGLDLVELQLRVAAGEPLPAEVLAATSHGHAVEARLYAEDPSRGFLPQPGRIERFRLPEGVSGVRVDAGYAEGGEVTPHYDPLMAKVSAHGETRAEAVERLLAALSTAEVVLSGPRGPRETNLAFLQEILRHPAFRSGEYDTGLLARMLEKPAAAS